MSKIPNSRPGFIHIGDILGTVIQSYQKRPEGQLSRIWDLWNEAVGPLISENTKPAAFKGQHLIVYVKSSAWLQELQFLKRQIIDKLNAVIGEKAVEDIRFKIGQF